MNLEHVFSSQVRCFRLNSQVIFLRHPHQISSAHLAGISLCLDSQHSTPLPLRFLDHQANRRIILSLVFLLFPALPVYSSSRPRGRDRGLSARCSRNSSSDLSWAGSQLHWSSVIPLLQIWQWSIFLFRSCIQHQSSKGCPLFQ